MSPSGFPFLVLRKDTGKYAYQRDLNPSLALHVSGDVSLDWTARIARLEPCRSVIKISLSTGDEKTARVRWLHVHTQVEALLQLAQIAANTEAVRKKAVRPVEGLAPGVSATIAGQLKHDRLNAHDQGWIDPTFTSPLAGVVLKLLRQSTVEAADRKLIEGARRKAEDIEHQQARAALREREPGWVDRSILVSELDASLFDIEGLRSGRITHFTTAQMRAMHEAEAKATTMPSEIDCRLAENGLALPEGHADRRALALSLLRTQVSTHEIIKRRDAGAGIDTPSRPPTMMPRPAALPAQPSQTLSAMREAWILDKRPEQKPRDDNALYVGYFVSLFGDLPVADITRPMIDQYLKLLDRCARNVPHALRRGSLMARAEWSELPDNRGKRRLKRRTINAKGLGSLSACLTQAERLGLVSANPCKGMDLDESVDEVMKRKPYSLTNLKKIYATSIYKQPAVVPKAGCGAAAFWLPLLAMFAGARLEELGQLELADVKVADRIPYLHITDVTDDDDDAAKPEGAATKSVKTNAARRRVPLHPTLLQLGFMNFVAGRRRRGATRLFHELPVYRNRCTKEFSKWWGRHTDEHVTKEPDKTFHSFRHLFIAKLRAAEVPEERIKASVGHRSSDTTLGYGDDGEGAFSLEILLSDVERISFPGLDLTKLGWNEA
ncbi:site-specific integrase [Lichenihabitans sp. Uapishka_5]|uniref:site-specific integrase n=1 Tax=Lichenihabitans sp. Uapishka_5 TaxID=3037302 RepID=UPI0029E7D6A2|nr:site-specific integrase [Lichenihabitans sp. Uapishka_5]MDX7949738.1 site-specific integrase [Lichenihabitans sp. Uapishka_5]